MKGARVFFGLTASSTTDDPINTRVQDAKTFLKMKRITLKINVLLCKQHDFFRIRPTLGQRSAVNYSYQHTLWRVRAPSMDEQVTPCLPPNSQLGFEKQAVRKGVEMRQS